MKNISVNNGMLEMGGLSAEQIARAAGTPVYIYDEAQIEANMQAYVDGFQSEQFATKVIYASKAFCSKAMCRLAMQYGLGLDVVSGGELYTALQAGFPMKDIVFHGNNKSAAELDMALDNAIGTIVLDNVQEARQLADISFRYPHVQLKALLRVNPGIEAHTHKYIQTSKVDSKFGISLQKADEILQTIQIIQETENITFAGLHCHIGSQIFEADAFLQAIDTMLGFIKELKDKGIELSILDLGGGFGVHYTDKDKPISIADMTRTLVEKLEQAISETGVKLNEVWIEPGRSIVAEAGATLYTVGHTKETPHKKYVFIDGGMADNIRPALYQAEYAADIANRMNEAKDETVTIAGKCCESGDIIAEDLPLQKAENGDLLITWSTGAYGYSMASNYNRLGVPGVVFVKDGSLRQVIRPQTYADLVASETDEILL